MSKFEGDIVAAGPGPVELDELRAGPGRRAPIAAERHDALARYLSGGEGWRDALAALHGAFAATAPPRPRLTAGKDR